MNWRFSIDLVVDQPLLSNRPNALPLDLAGDTILELDFHKFSMEIGGDDPDVFGPSLESSLEA